MVMMMIQKKLLVSSSRFPSRTSKVPLTTHSSYHTTRNPSSSLRLGTSICFLKSIAAPFHSRSLSDSQTQTNSPRSVLDLITNLNDALKLFDEMTHRQPLPSVIKFNQLLQAITKMKHYSSSIELFKQMNVLRVPVDVYTINIVIKCCCQMYRTREGFVVLGFTFRRLVIPDVCIFSTLLHGLVLEDRVLKAERIFKKLIHGLCNLCRWDDVSKMLKEMEDERIAPNVRTYNILVDAFCKEGKSEDAETVIDLMVERGTHPNVVTYTSLIDGYCLRGEMSKAKKVFELLGFRGLFPNVVTYNSLLNGYCKHQPKAHQNSQPKHVFAQ